MLALIKSLVALLASLGAWLRDRQLLTAGQAQSALATEQTTNAQVAKAIEAARASDAAVDRDPGRLRQPGPDSRD